ncbi:serine/threonine-protein kinase [Paludisphaera rhizosphaerae]|uniref:serine/threonine-protein kinase n=1 Tax=Paludisphaera rhizosphaerae TaxID=2711216 RepID=UPI0013EC9273|nr:serine/threonine-protein kinase [Paludisphaera rhizosphaerae]
MNPSRLDEEAIFHAARRIDDPEARVAYLMEACADDATLRRRIVRLLRVYESDESFLAEPPCALTPAQSAGVASGEVIGPYRLVNVIGEGGMGVVYMAEQSAPVRRQVALKIVKPGMDTKQVIARFEIERQALAMMDHPNIARVFDAGATAQGRPYFVMELVHGLPITEYCDRERLSVPERLELFVLVCRAVQHAHQKGVIHRDIKPSNILVTLQDGVATPKVIDFGIAKAVAGSLTDKTLFTTATQFVGTPMYMSPEQAGLAGVDVDTRSDVYSLGVVLYELLTGTTPFDSTTFREAAFDDLRRLIREEEPPKLSTRLGSLGEMLTVVSADRQVDPRRLDRTIRGDLDWIVMKAMEKDRGRRYQTANDFAADVMRFLNDQPVDASPPSTWYRFTKYARRNRAALTTVSLVAAALVLGLAASVATTVRAIKAEQKTAAALTRVRESLAEVDRQRDRARRVVDDMYTQVAERWLTREGSLSPIQREFLEKALAFYEEFAREQSGDPRVRVEAAKAAERVGQIRHRLGLHAAAKEAIRKTLDTWRRLVDEQPEQPEHRRGLAHSLCSMGSAHMAIDEIADAERTFREAVALQRPLAEAPGLPEDHWELAMSLRSLSQLLWLTGRDDECEQVALQGISMLNRLVAEHPEDSSYLRGLALAEMDLASEMCRREERLADAEVRARRAIDLFRRQVNEDPSDPLNQANLGSAYQCLANTYRFRHRPREAVEELRLALPIWERLAADDPNLHAVRRSLGGTLHFLAEQLMWLQQYDEAEPLLSRSVEVVESLIAEFPTVPLYRSDLAVCTSKLGRLLAQHGRNAEAREAFDQSCENMRNLVKDHPESAFYRRCLASNCYTAAVDYATFQGGEPGDAVRARDLAREAIQVDSRAAGFWMGLALAEYRCGDLDAALTAETRSLQMRKGYASNYDWLLLALIHLERGDRQQAQEWACRAFNNRSPGDWRAAEPDLSRLIRENEARLRSLLPACTE